MNDWIHLPEGFLLVNCKDCGKELTSKKMMEWVRKNNVEPPDRPPFAAGTILGNTYCLDCLSVRPKKSGGTDPSWKGNNDPALDNAIKLAEG